MMDLSILPIQDMGNANTFGTKYSDLRRIRTGPDGTICYGSSGVSSGLADLVKARQDGSRMGMLGQLKSIARMEKG